MNTLMEPHRPPTPRGLHVPVVLIVDDEPNVLAAARRALRSETFLLETTSDPTAALERIARGGVDVVVCDQLMPGMTGFTLLDLAQERSPSTKRAIWTGQAGGISRLEGWQGIVQCVIEKAQGDDELKAVIRHLLAGWRGS